MGARAFRGASLRTRLVVTAVGIVAVTLLSGAIGLVAILRSSLERGVTNTALTRAADVASLAKANTLPVVLAFPGEERSIIQVVDANGTVLASTANISGEAPLANASRSPYTASNLPIGDRQRFRMTAMTVDTIRGRMTIVSGESLERVDGTLRTVRVALGAGLPALLAIVAALAWIGTRRALRPVEAIRAEVAEITDSDLHRRVPEPNGADEIAHLAQTMNAMLDRLEVARERQARFVSDASHELRSPLTSLRAVLEIGLARTNRSDWPERAEGALADVDRLDRLVRDLLTLGRATSGDTTAWVRCDLSEIVSQEVARYPMNAAVAIIESSCSGSWVHGDGEQLARVIGNLLTNAVRHARCAVHITTSVTRAGVVVEVTDDGPGIPLADRDRIFERFVRLDEARGADDGGSGLGLSIVRSIVAAHGGTVAIVGGPPGAAFRVVLPRAT